MLRRGWYWLMVGGVLSTLVQGGCSGAEKRRVPYAKPEPSAAEMAAAMKGLAEAGDDRPPAVVAAPQEVVPAADFSRRGPNGSQEITAGEPIWLLSGKSRVFHSARPVQRVSIGHPDVAAVVVLDAHSFMINGKEIPDRKKEDAPGLSDRMGMPVGRTLTAEPRYVETTLSIWVEGDKHIDTHTMIIADFVDEQVLLEVTVAELNRSAMEEHGLDVRAIQKDFIAAAFMGGGAGPGALTVPPLISKPLLPLTANGASTPDYAFIFPNEDITVFFKVLQTEGLATVLAQPKLLAMSGQNAVFQVGGEIPIRIATGFTSDIQFKPFGTLVNFLARVSDEGDIMLTVSPEVSEPDFSNTVENIPTFRTRRASTSARLRNGETLVIGGLLQSRRQEEEKGVPYLKDVPFLGWFFRQTRYTNDTTELMVVVKPSLVHALPAGAEVALPTDGAVLKREEVRTQPNGTAVTRPRFPGLE